MAAQAGVRLSWHWMASKVDGLQSINGIVSDAMLPPGAGLDDPAARDPLAPATDEAVQQLDQHSRCVAAAARARAVPVQSMLVQAPGRGPRVWLQMQAGGRTWFYRSGVLRHGGLRNGRLQWHHVNGAAASLTIDKALTNALLAAAGVSAPVGALFAADQQALALTFFRALGRPVCVKPNRGRKGICVTPDCTDGAAVAAAFARAAQDYGRVLVEESVAGEVIRFYWVAPGVVGVKHSLPPNVVGDGRCSIAALVEAKNQERAARYIPGHLPIVIDEALIAYIASHGLSLDSVPAAGTRVRLRALSNGAVGADSIACADSTHPSYSAVIDTACRAFPGLRVAAIDMMIGDRSQPAAPGNHWILEINSSPGVLPYHYPWEGEPQDVSGALVDLMLGRRQAAGESPPE
jgi:D-alanine-D-alanine ligase-like ATP-grasp enzyme